MLNVYKCTYRLGKYISAFIFIDFFTFFDYCYSLLILFTFHTASFHSNSFSSLMLVSLVDFILSFLHHYIRALTGLISKTRMQNCFANRHYMRSRAIVTFYGLSYSHFWIYCKTHFKISLCIHIYKENGKSVRRETNNRRGWRKRKT